MKILGISCYYHDSAACLIIDGKIVAAAAEERFTRVKHDNNFPINAINFCLQKGQILSQDLDSVVFYEKPLIKLERIFSQHLEYFPKSYFRFVKHMAQWMTHRLNLKRTIKEQVHYLGDIFFVEHHLAHAASSYYLSNFENASIVTIDGVGEWTTTAIGFGKDNNIELQQKINFPNSLGLLYSTFTTYLGFEANDAEYKVMGLAAFGKVDKKLLNKFSKLIKINGDGSYELDMKYFSFGYGERMYSKEFINLFGRDPRTKEAEITSFHENLAATLQFKIETVVFNLLNKVHAKQKNPNLCFSGGVALNSVLNGKILAKTPYENLFIPPDPSDAGGAMGAALYIANKFDRLDKKLLGNDFSPYLGPDFSWFQIKNVLDKYKKDYAIDYELITSKTKLLKLIADKLIDQKIVAWFQGRMEWGPRALGNRSILAVATKKEMQEIINSRVKNRELFRPFAPVIFESKIKDYFKLDKKSKDNLSPSNRWMLTVYPFLKSKKKEVPAVVHVDGSGRLESLRRSDNQMYYDLLDVYYKKTGIPILINTSFNVRGEPIICRPHEALDCFLKTDIDYLVMDQFVVRKVEQKGKTIK
jgi:carbamoyltransferase